ncbi:MAG TPA: MBL fold metallo-hydrolase [Candidatus Eisenbacteria bacterium]|nr:MBL fold metallo-hydrolase [Candidatus Eisenbacteria bacterium]
MARHRCRVRPILPAVQASIPIAAALGPVEGPELRPRHGRLPIGALFLALTVTLGSGCAAPFLVSSRTDAAIFPRPPHDSITFWGHASVYVDIGGVGIVTDPVYGPSYSPFHARRIPAPPPESYDRAAIVLISHAHQDHLQPETLERFPPGALILCPEPSARYLRSVHQRVRPMRPGDTCSFVGGRIIAVPADHPGGRRSTSPHDDGRALGYVIEAPTVTVYYSGDTRYFWGLERIGDLYSPDVAVLNVNRHLPPVDALLATSSLGATRAIAIHEGAYGGRAGANGKRWHAEFLELAGPLARDLRVGESVALGDLPARVKSTTGVRPWSIAAKRPAAEVPSFGIHDRLLTRSGRILAAPDPSVAGIAHFAEMEAGLFRGGRPSDDAIHNLRRRGVRSIVNLRHDDHERSLAEAAGFRYFEIPLRVGLLGSAEPTEEDVRRFLDLATDPANRPLFFHDRRGRGGTGVMAAFYRIELDRWPADDAIEEMEAFGSDGVRDDILRDVDRDRGWRLTPLANVGGSRQVTP